MMMNTPKITITYKEKLAGSKPYLVLETVNYLNMLSTRQDELYKGNLGVYLSRRVHYDGQELYFLFWDIDGEGNTEQEKIQDAIQNITLTLKSLQQMNAAEMFYIIATGGTGFRLFSPALVNLETYKSFIDFSKSEMPYIHDLKPTKDLDMPHQLLAYKGNLLQSNNPVDRHSVLLSPKNFINSNFSVDDYIQLTLGNPDPNNVIRNTKLLLEFYPVSDLRSLNGLGTKINDYKSLYSDMYITPFNINNSKIKKVSVDLETMSAMLTKKGILHKIEQRGHGMAISFQGLPCPQCGDRSVNARAYPPAYRLQCFNTDCPANDKPIPLKEWAGITISSKYDFSSSQSSGFPMRPPSRFINMNTVQSTIQTALTKKSNSLIIITPGSGKTHFALEYLAKNMTHKLVFYSSLNKKLQEEAYNKIKCKDFNPPAGTIHMLNSKEALCLHKDELNIVINQGYMPFRILCPHCESRTNCPYILERQNISTGIYFVTHPMLYYLKYRMSLRMLVPDMIVVDENILKGFYHTNECTEANMRTLSRVLSTQDFNFIDKILGIGRHIATQNVNEPFATILNDNRLSDESIEEDSIINILAKNNKTEESKIIDRIEEIIQSITSTDQKALFKSGVNFKAVNWLEGLVSKEKYSFMWIDRKANISFKVKYFLQLDYPNTSIKILDATGHKKIAELILQQQVYDVRKEIEWNSKRVHIKKDTSRSVLKYAKDSHLRTLFENSLREISTDKIMILTYKFLRDNNRIQNICEDLEPNKSFMYHHFFGPRGINDFMDCEAVIVIGLPYENLNSCWQDGHIIFPEGNEEYRNSWVDWTMLYELIQCIHRIRPILKNNVEIVIASQFWPPILPKPDKVIDQSQNKNWKELAIQMLDPYIKKFGFINQDIAFLAGIKIRNRKAVDEKLLNPIKKLNLLFQSNEIKFLSDHMNVLRSYNDSSETLSEEQQIMVLKDSFKKKQYISSIKLMIYMFIIKSFNETTYLKKLFKMINNNELISNSIELLLNTKQWGDIKFEFQQRYPYLERFKIRLPHSRNRFVEGVGIKDQVITFYTELSKVGIVKNMRLDSYETVEESIYHIEPVPQGCVVIYVPEEDFQEVFVSNNDSQLIKIQPVQISNLFENLPSVTIVTNDGKYVAKQLLSCNINRYTIHDICLTERLLQNGRWGSKETALDDVFELYAQRTYMEILTNTNVTISLSQMIQIYQEQIKVIEQESMTNVYELEKQMIWVIAGIELNGFYFDTEGFLQFIESGEADSNKYKTDANTCLKLLDEDNRIHDNINQMTQTGRMSCSLHGIAKDGPIRSFFTAPEGYQLISADYSQFEARVIAGLAQDKNAIDLFISGKDIFLELAKSYTGKTEEGCQVYRNIFKDVVHILNNGGTEYTVLNNLTARSIQCSIHQASDLIKTYYEMFPSIGSWRDIIISKARNDGFIKTINGRKLYVTQETKDTGILNFPITGNSADGFKSALVLFGQCLKEQNLVARIVHTQHDEIFVEARDDIAKQVTEVLEECMGKAFQDMMPNVPFVTKPGIVDSWS